MPELPEVETIRRGLSRLIVGKTISHVAHDNPKSFPNPPHDVDAWVIGARITDIRRRAKVLMIDLSTDYTLVIHLKMTGQLVFIHDKNKAIGRWQMEDGYWNMANHKEKEPNGTFLDVTEPSSNSHLPNASEAPLRFGAGHPTDSLIGVLPDRSTRVTLAFDDGSHLYFNDQRKFGWMKLYPTIEVSNIDFMKRVGPEPLEDDFTPEQFAERFARRKNTTIKAALLDQTVVAGVGNIYADESLWGARIHPSRRVSSISSQEFHSLFHELRYVLNLSIEKGGSTDKNYVNAEGKRGSYIDFARVFRRENLPCPRCGTTIVKSRVAGRGTHTCPVCQLLS